MNDSVGDERLKAKPPTDGGGFRDFYHKLDEFYFTTTEKEIFGQL
jgi:hypothetical protein